MFDEALLSLSWLGGGQSEGVIRMIPTVPEVMFARGVKWVGGILPPCRTQRGPSGSGKPASLT